MKIKILNKNDNAWYEVDEAPIGTEVKNETLDSGTIIISNQTSKIKIEPYDIVEIDYEYDWLNKYMCVDTYTEVMTGVNPKVYKYEIHLFSETKLLEGIICPNLKITKKSGTVRSIWYYINQYVNEYSTKIRIQSGNTYSFENKWKTVWNGASSHPNLEIKFADECPEMQWNTPTLREVLNDLMMVKDCIPIIKNGRIDYIDLTQVNNKNWDSDEHINYVTRSKSSEDYVSELQVKLENVTNNESLENNVVVRSEYFPLTCSDEEATLTTNNMTIKTQYPIYRIKSLRIMFPAKIAIRTTQDGNHSDSYVVKWFEEELTQAKAYNFLFTPPLYLGTANLVYEYQEWLTKNTLYDLQYPGNLIAWSNYREYTLYYKRGDNQIHNINNLRNFLFLTDPLYQELCIQIAQNNIAHSLLANQEVLAVYPPKWYDLFFKIEYETLEGCLFRASKSDVVEHDRVVIDNQTNSYVDSYAQGFLEYQKANRLGNEQLQINARFSPDDRLIEIGDMYEECVIYQCQYQYYKDHIEINALATKNYILRDYFTGVKSKIRSWAIVSGSEALTRHDLVKIYCEFSYHSHPELQGLSEILSTDLVSYLVTPLTDYTADPMKYCFVRTTNGNIYYPSPSSNVDGIYQDSYYSVDLLKRIVGNSIVLTFGFSDNYWAGKQYDPNKISPSNMTLNNSLPIIKSSSFLSLIQSIFSGETGIPTQQYDYTDSFGENIGGEIIFFNDIVVAPGEVDYSQPESPIDEPDTYLFMNYVYRKPRVWYNNIDENAEKFGISYSYKKDSQEITNISTQIEFSSDTNDICFGKNWINRQKLVNSANNRVSNFKLIAYNKNVYDFKNPDKLPSSGLLEEGNVYLSTNSSGGQSININIHWLKRFNSVTQLRDFVRTSCFYLNDGDASSSKVLLAFDNPPNGNITIVDHEGEYYTVIFNIYLNVLRTRNKNIYDEDNHYLVVDNI